MSGRVVIFDTTLRDGEQSPGCSMNADEKIRLARQLERLGADVIEAGFPIASQGEIDSVRAVAQEIRSVRVAALARAKDADIEAAAKALEGAARPLIHTFLATSAIHLKYKLKITPEEALRQAVAGVRLARTFTPDVEFSAEDASRTDYGYLREVLQAVFEAGAITLNVPDTVGYSLPHEYGAMVARLVKDIPGGDHLGSLPQRPRARRGQLPRRRPGRSPAGGMHDQRHRRAGRKHVARGNRDGAQDPPRFFRTRTRASTREAPRADSALLSDDHGHGRPAQQGHRRPQRLRPRGRHPSARRAARTPSPTRS